MTRQATWKQSRRVIRAQGEACGRMWRAIRNGTLPDLRGIPCADCGRTSLEHDHRDYAKWWEVVGVCKSCNRKRGRALPFLRVPHCRASYVEAHRVHLNQFALSLACATDEPYEATP